MVDDILNLVPGQPVAVLPFIWVSESFAIDHSLCSFLNCTGLRLESSITQRHSKVVRFYVYRIVHTVRSL